MTKEAEADKTAVSVIDTAEFATLKGEVRSLTKGMQEFVVETRARFVENENELRQFGQRTEAAIQKVAEELQRSGKPNWGVLVAIGALILTIAAAAGGGWIHPLQVDLDNQKEQRRVDRAEAREDMKALSDEFVDRLNEVKEGQRSRDAVTEKRLDDVTAREDRRSDDDRRELDALKLRLLLPTPATK